MVSQEEKEKVIGDILTSIDDVTLAALDTVDPPLSEVIKTLSPKDIEFGECIKLRKYLFSGNVRSGIIQKYINSSRYNVSSHTREDTSGWRTIQYFIDKKFTDDTGWLICNTEYDYISVFKKDIADLYRQYSMEINYGGGTLNPDTIFASENPENRILTVTDKKLAAMNLAYSFGQRLVLASTITYVGEFRCGSTSLDSYTCDETDKYAELPICPIFVSLKDGTKVPIGSYLTTSKKTSIQFYGKEEEINKEKSEILSKIHEEQRKQKRKHHLQLGLKIAGGVLAIVAALTLALTLLT